jgi:hypothetical protein
LKEEEDEEEEEELPNDKVFVPFYSLVFPTSSCP